MVSIILISIMLSVFSTAVMSYIAMATPIGPWIAPTLVLVGAPLCRLMASSLSTHNLSLVVISGSIGGILATALGFSFPTLYFVDPSLFSNWMADPAYFVTMIGAIALIGGWLGLWLAYQFEERLIVIQQLPFPIGQLVWKMVTAITQELQKAYELIAGFLLTAIFCLLQDGVGLFRLIPQSVTLVNSSCVGFVRIPLLRFDLVPFVWAVGFLTGHVIAFPLLVGAVSRVVVLDPLNTLSIFSHLSSTEFVLAFCSGLVLIGTLTSFVGLPKQLYYGIKRGITGTSAMHGAWSIDTVTVVEFCVLITTFFLFFSYLNFSIIAQIFILVTTSLCAYQMAAIAGKIGMALLGRFATFVMVPGMLFFGFNVLQAVLVATFVEVCGGVMTDALFGRVVARDAHIPKRISKFFHYLGLVVACCVVGAVFWMLIDHFHLGSDQLFAQKAQARQLLLQAKQFDPYVVFLGALFGLILSFIHINPALVFGGLLMPVNLVMGLVMGGVISWALKNKQDYFPFVSGIFASQSIWMLLKALAGF